MDRQIVYIGQIPQDTDQLQQNKNAMIGLGYALQAVLGTSTVVDGLACTPTVPASLTVNVAPGSIYSLQNVDGTAYGSLPADTSDQIVKQGIVMTTTNLSCPAPATTGQSINYLVQVAYQDQDGGLTVLPYYNASNPSVAWSGPNNTGISQNTVRKGACLVQIKAGVAATTGTQVTPSPDAGFTGLYAVTVANGQTTIVSGNIAQLASAPFINPKLTGVVPYIQSGSSTYAADAGTASVLSITLFPTPSSLTTGMGFRVKAANTNAAGATMLINGNGPYAIKVSDGNAIPAAAMFANGLYSFTFDGTYVWLQSPSASASLLKHGQCVLSLSGGNLVLKPSGGNGLFFPGSGLLTIPSSGVSVAVGAALTEGGTPAANTTYYVYAYINSGAIAIQLSATAHATDPGTGVETRSGDNSRVLVGMVRVGSGPAYSSAALGLLSYFNRKDKADKNGFTATRTTTSTSWVEINSEIEVNFLTWGDETVTAVANGPMWPALSVTSSIGACLGFDGATPEDGCSATTNVSMSTQILSNVAVHSIRPLSEGWHYATLLGKTNNGSAAASYAGTSTNVLGGSGQTTDRCTIYVKVRG